MSEIEKRQQDILQVLEERIGELKNIRQLLVKCQKDYECAVFERDMVRKQNERLLISLKDCANELCLKCGKHRNSHLGACDDCKWKDVKDWDVT